MTSRRMKLAKAVLGDSLFESLQKSIVKSPTGSVVDITEAHDALQIAPKSVMAFIMAETKDMPDMGAKEISVPFAENTMMLLNKATADQYSGHFVQKGKIVHEFHNVSIPQLSSHILSLFELYDESPGNEDGIETEQSVEGSVEASPGDANMAGAIEELRHKVDQLFMMMVSQKQSIIVNTVPLEPTQKSEKPEDKKKHLKNILRKAGLMPTMPKPKLPGKNAGMQGISHAGFHDPKTAASDTNTKIVTADTKNPSLKVPKGGMGAPKVSNAMPKMSTSVPKMNAPAGKPAGPKMAGGPKEPQMGKSLTFTKSELSAPCSDCGKTGHCLCFKALSKPDIKKNEDGKVVLHFGADWDAASLTAFYESIKRIRDEH
jgi:hypothetical protein